MEVWKGREGGTLARWGRSIAHASLPERGGGRGRALAVDAGAVWGGRGGEHSATMPKEGEREERGASDFHASEGDAWHGGRGRERQGGRQSSTQAKSGRTKGRETKQATSRASHARMCTSDLIARSDSTCSIQARSATRTHTPCTGSARKVYWL